MPELLRGERPGGRVRRGGRGAGRRARARSRPLARAARPQRHRQDDAPQHAGRRDAAARRPDRARRPRRHRAAAAPPRRRRHRLGAAGAEHLQVAHASTRTSPPWPGPGRGRRRVPTPCSRAWPSARPTSAASSRAASSRCSRSRARSSSIRRCCCSTSRSRDSRRSSSRSCCGRSRSSFARTGLSAIIVEQNPRLILPITHDADRSRSRRDRPRRVEHGAARGPRDARQMAVGLVRPAAVTAPWPPRRRRVPE